MTTAYKGMIDDRCETTKEALISDGDAFDNDIV